MGNQLQGYLNTHVNKAKAIFKETKTVTSLTMKRKVCSVASHPLCLLSGLASTIPVVVTWENNGLGRLPYVYSAIS